MQLSAEQFNDIIAHLISDLSGKAIEKRREPRVGVRFDAVIATLVPGMPNKQEKITIRDLSRSGINVLSHKQMTSGTEFIINMPRADKLQITALYRVCHSKPLGSTLYAIGASLLSVTNSTKTVAA